MNTSKKTSARKRPTASAARAPSRSTAAGKAKRTSSGVAEILADLQRMGSEKVRRQMLEQFGVPNDDAFGVGMVKIHALARRLGRDHELALKLWKSGNYEARTLAAFVAEPAMLTPAQMDEWCRGFNSWAICDTHCFHLFDKTPHAFRKIEQWADRSEEFVKRAAFALLAGLALHDKAGEDAPFRRCLPLVEKAADDPRNFVKKGVSWALRAVAGRSPDLHAAALELASRLAQSDIAPARWIGRDTLRDITRPLVVQRAEKRAAQRAARLSRKSRPGR